MNKVLIIIFIFFQVSMIYASGPDAIIPQGKIQQLKIEEYNISSFPQNSWSKSFALQSKDDSNLSFPSKKKSVFLSMLLPGLGERKIGSMKSSKIFFSSEAALWLTVIGFSVVAEWKEEDYKAFAAEHGGVSYADKSDNYYGDIANYDNLYDYNADKRRQRNPDDTYPETVDYIWNWDDDASRVKYKSLRVDRESAKQVVTFTAGALLVNRLLSVMDTVWRYNRSTNAQSTDLSVGYTADGISSLSLNIRF